MQIRWAALDAMGRISLTSLPAADALLEALNDSEATIRALHWPDSSIGRASFVETFSESPKCFPIPPAGSFQRRAKAIGRAGTSATNALPALEALSQDTNETVRASARDAATAVASVR
jgi:hypothetical protein